MTAFRGDFCSSEIFHQIVIGEEPSNSTSSFYRANADIGTGHHRLELSPSDSTLRFNRRIFVVYWLRIQNLCLNVYVNLVYLTPITSFKFYFAIESLKNDQTFYHTSKIYPVSMCTQYLYLRSDVFIAFLPIRK